MARNFVLKLPLFVFCALLFSCAAEKPVQFPVEGTGAVLLGGSREAQEGLLYLSKGKKIEYRFDTPSSIPADSSLEIEYVVSLKSDTPTSGISDTPVGVSALVLNMGTVSWQLPVDFTGIRYAIPVHDSFDGYFNIAVETTGKTDKKDAPVLKISGICFTERWFGFVTDIDEYDSYTPFVDTNEGGSYKIDVPPAFMNRQPAEIKAGISGGKRAILEFADKKIETYPGINTVFIPSALYAGGQVAFLAERVHSFVLTPCSPPAFPKPVKADPALVINWPKENWRNKNYEVFQWDRFPSLLIFDYADYAVQDKMLKRLAFFVEKTGFRGRLAPDSEIKELHGWNAHDYREQDLAAFFDLAEKINFPLLDEELSLKNILLNEGIIRESSDGIAAGSGGIVSISRESANYLRYRFLAHEGFHGLFFIDADFRDFSRERWEKLPAAAKRFIVSYFEFQQYDTKDEYLLINEFMGHIMQQSVSGAADYFGRNLPMRLESSWRAGALPKKDEDSGTWPVLADAFTAEAKAFSDYVNRRWGLAAGRVWGLQIR
ncbi:MAG: hypothetical protein LBI04_07480 [Treponema sp.]|jgi:hypothetical protein|nr:hypothetical protein [Treponema sp.]